MTSDGNKALRWRLLTGASMLTMAAYLTHVAPVQAGTITSSTIISTSTSGQLWIGGDLSLTQNGTISGPSALQIYSNPGRLTNDGVISGGTYAISNNASLSTLTNNGLISGGQTGISNASGAAIGTIMNTGTIVGTAAYSLLNAGVIGTIVNTGVVSRVIRDSGSIDLLTNQGSISAGGTALIVSGMMGTLVNAGTMSSPRGAVYVASTGTLATLSNTGSLSANNATIASGAGLAIGAVVNAGGVIGTLTNQGTIASSGTITTTVYDVGAGVANMTGATIQSLQNNGVISSSVTNNTSGLGGIQPLAAVFTDGSIGTLANNAGGTITDTANRDAQGIQIGTHGTIATLTNAAGATISGYGGVYVTGQVGLLANAGLISGSVTGVWLYGGTIGTLQNSGTIHGDVGGIGLDLGSRIQVLINNGLISSGSSPAIYNDATIGTLINNGLISLGSWAIYNAGTIGTLINNGLIAGATAVINLGSLGTLSNSGTISGNLALFNGGSGTLAAVVNSGLIAGSISNASSRALTISGGSGSVFGTLTGVSGGLGASDMGTITSPSADLVFASGNLILNDNIGASGHTVSNTGAVLRLSNVVSITGSYSQGAGVLAVGVNTRLAVSGAASVTGGSASVYDLQAGGTYIAGTTAGTIVAGGAGSSYAGYTVGSNVPGLALSDTVSGNSLLWGVGNDYIGAGYGTLANTGTLSSPLGAVYVASTGTLAALSNTGSLSANNATIASGAGLAIGAVVNAGGVIGTLTNQGTIASSGTITTTVYDVGAGVANMTGATIQSLQNNGLISSSITNNTSGFGGIQPLAAVFTDGSIGTLANNAGGTITDTANRYAQGIQIGTHGTIATLTNAAGATISGYVGVTGTGQVGLLTNAGLISGSADGVWLYGGTIGTLQNSGTIHGDFGGIGLDLGSRIQVLINNGLISSGSSAAIYNDATIGTLINNGLIAGATAVNNLGSLGTLSNSGTISGNHALFNGGSGTLAAVVNSGLIAGSISNASSRALTISGGSGSVFGTLTGVSGGLGASDMGTITSPSADLVFASGNLILNDNIGASGHTVSNTGAVLRVDHAVSITGTYAQAGGGLLITAASPSSYGYLAVSGNASVSNAGLSIAGAGLSAGNSFTIVRAGGTGSYAGDVAQVNMTSGLTANVSTVGQDLVVSLAAGAPLHYWDGGVAANHGNGVVDGGGGTWSATGQSFTDAAGLAAGAMTPVPGSVIFAGAAGTVTVDTGAGSVSVAGLDFVTDGYAVNGGTLTLAAGSTTIQAGDVSASGAGVTATIAAALTGPGGLLKTGTGTLALGGTSSYAGGTTIAGGTLAVNGALPSASAVSVLSGATLGGAGAVGTVTVASGGTIAGVQGQTLTTGDLTLNPGAHVAARLTDSGSAALVSVQGNLALNGVLDVSTATGAFGAGLYRIISYTGALTGSGLSVGAITGSVNVPDVAVQTDTGTRTVNLISNPTTASYWNAGQPGAVQGGDGTWDANTLWTNVQGSNSANILSQATAIFAGAAGTVTVDTGAGAVTIGGMQFVTDGYRVEGGAITLIDAQTNVRVGDGTGAGAATTATIASALTGTGGLVKTDYGTLLLTGANSYTGGTAVTAGRLALGNAAALGTGPVSLDEGTTLAFTADMTLANAISFPDLGDPMIDTGAHAVTIAGVISGVGDLSKLGTGTLTLTGQDGYTGATDVVAGTLVVTGSIAASSGVTVEAGATLGGAGTVSSLTVFAGGTVAPGVATSYSTLSVAGNVTFQAGSTYRVGIDAAGRTDAVVASGTATLSGGTVDVVAGSGSYAASTTYRILTASGGRTGTFDTLSTTTNLAFLTPYLSYDATGVDLAFTRTTTLAGGAVVTFPSVAGTPNQRAAAAAIEALGAGRLYGAVLSQTAAGARAAFDAVSGEMHASAVTAGIEDTRLVREAIFGRLEDAGRQDRDAGALGAVAAFGAPQADLPTVARGYAAQPAGPVTAGAPAPYGVWGTGFGDFGTNGGNGNAAALGRSLGGFVLGADARLDAAMLDGWRVGVAGGYTNDTLRVKERASTGSFESYFGGLYAGTRYGALDIKLGLLGGGTQTNTRRSVAFPGFSDTVYASTGGAIVQGFGELGYRIGLGRGILEPVLQGAAIHIDQDGFREQGGAAAVRGLGHGTDVETTTPGLRAEVAPFAAWPLTAQGFVGWRHAYGDVDPKALLAFTGGTTAFTVSGAPIDRDAVVAEAGLDYHASQVLTLGISYTGQAGARASDNGVKGRMEYRF